MIVAYYKDGREIEKEMEIKKDDPNTSTTVFQGTFHQASLIKFVIILRLKDANVISPLPSFHFRLTSKYILQFYMFVSRRFLYRLEAINGNSLLPLQRRIPRDDQVSKAIKALADLLDCQELVFRLVKDRWMNYR